MNALEGGVGALAFASGHAAIIGAICNIAQTGDEIVSSTTLYGGTYNMFSNTMPRLGIKVNFADGTPEAMEKAITSKTKALYAETIGNPKMDVADIEGMAKVAHKNGLPFIIDATFTPYINRAIDFGADVVLHSATKFIDGHGTSMGGIVIDAGKFNWDSEKFPLMSKPDPSYHGLRFCDVGEAAYISRMRTQILRDIGGCLSPFNSFLFVKGLETLHLRMERHCDNALAVAQHLEKHEKVAWVSYPGLESHPDNALAKKYFPRGSGALIAFGVKGGLTGGRNFIDGLKMVTHAANLGDARSLVIHPASTTHSQLDDEQKKSAGISDDLVRLSVGIESVEDIINDLEDALACV
jgi:O-acetylhomoserine (thiol)-lyase